jgi:hypothetical protein
MNLSEIEGFEKYLDYSVSSDGDIISHKRKKDRVLKGGENTHGYLQVNIYLNGKRKRISIHRLVAKAFCKGYSEGLTVDHINENKKDNRVFNLQYLTRGDNTRKSKSKPVAQLTLDGELIKIWDSMMEAQREGGFNQSSISKACSGRYKTHAGFKWEDKI